MTGSTALFWIAAALVVLVILIVLLNNLREGLRGYKEIKRVEADVKNDEQKRQELARLMKRFEELRAEFESLTVEMELEERRNLWASIDEKVQESFYSLLRCPLERGVAIYSEAVALAEKVVAELKEK